MLKSKSGFSLMELIVVILIIGTLSAISIPLYVQWRESAALTGAISELTSNIQFSRNTAIKNNSNVVIQFTQTQYRIYSDGNDDWVEEALIKLVVLPANVNFNIALITLNNQRTSFNDRGMPKPLNTGNIVMSNQDNNGATIQLTRLGRMITTRF